MGRYQAVPTHVAARPTVCWRRLTVHDRKLVGFALQGRFLVRGGAGPLVPHGPFGPRGLLQRRSAVDDRWFLVERGNVGGSPTS